MSTVKRYLDWSTEVLNNSNQNQVALFYLSAYANTLDMAKKIEEGLVSEGVKVTLYDLENMSLHEMHDAVVMSKVILLGSPTINRTMVKPMWDLFSTIDPMANQGKIAGVYGSYGWSGEAVQIISEHLNRCKIPIVAEGVRAKWQPKPDDLARCEDLGKEVAKAITT